MNTEHHIPYKRLCDLLHNVFGLSISEGTIYSMLQRMKTRGAGVYEQIRQRIASAPVVGADETGAHVNGKRHWLWSFQTERLTYAYSNLSRGKAAIARHFPDGLPRSWLVTDRYQPYFSLPVKGHQICLAHLLRELTYLNELAPKEPWPKEMKKLLQEAIHKRKTALWEKIDRQEILKRFNELLFCTFKEVNHAIEVLQKGLIQHRENVFRFLFYPDIPYDNNASERSIRPMKIKEKVSGGFRSEPGIEAYACIHSIADTARKNGQSPFVALKLIAHS
jgi:transposase